MVSPNDVFYQYHREPKVTAEIADECSDEISDIEKPSRSSYRARDSPDTGYRSYNSGDVERMKSLRLGVIYDR